MKRCAKWLTVAILCTAASAHAYNESGHIFTVANEIKFVAKLHDHVDVITLCAQLPDLVHEFDATTQRIAIIGTGFPGSWGLFNSCNETPVRQMATTQRYIHGLTGAPSAKVRAAAAELLQTLVDGARDDNDWCAVGLSLHLFGDSYAHSMLEDSNTLYPTGLGHFRDWHYPDYPLFGGRESKWPRFWPVKETRNPDRVELWSTYADSLAKTLGLNVAELATLTQDANTMFNDPTNNESDYWDDNALAAMFRKASALEFNPDSCHSDTHLFVSIGESCRQLLTEDSCTEGIRDSQLDCATFWDRYLTAAVPTFEKYLGANAFSPSCIPTYAREIQW